MDVRYFLTDRIAFILQLYENAAQPFVDRQRRIDEGEHPYPPKYREDDEPPYLEESIEVEESLQVLAYTCLSMLAGALHLYLATWRTQLPVGEPTGRKKGWLHQARADFLEWFGIDFEDAPSDLRFLEEIVLARNRIQHPEDIVSVLPSYSESDLERRPGVFFVTETERKMFARDGPEGQSWMWQPSLHVTPEKLRAAVAEVLQFSEWLEAQIQEKNL